MKKTASINIMTTPEAKKSLRIKAEALHLSVTEYIEKIAFEDVVFLDSNIKALLKTLTIK